MRFLHLADTHLDAAFGARSEAVRGALRAASRAGFARALEVAVARGVDAILIAGDLVDEDRVSVQTERFLCEAFARVREAGVPIVYATGNHDPGGSDLVGVLRREDLAHVVSEARPERIAIERDGRSVGFVTAAGHARSDVTDDLAAGFARPPGRAPEVALLHTQVVGARDAEAHDRYAPCELSALRASGFDYWALGHVHVRQALSDRPAIHYSGNAQGRDPRESGPKGALLVEIDSAVGPDRGVDVAFVELAEVRWETLVVDELRDVRRLQDLADIVESRWGREREKDPGLENGRWMLRVRLAGPSPMREALARWEAEEELLEALGQPLALLDLALDTRGLRSIEAVRDHVDRPDVLGEILRMVSELADPTGPSPAARLGITAADLAGGAGLSGEPLDRYLRDLLNGADSALVEAVLDRADE